jgi:hypothetical protein
LMMDAIGIFSNSFKIAQVVDMVSAHAINQQHTYKIYLLLQ